MKAENLRDDAGMEAARMFWTGLVEGHSMAFAPTVAEFMTQVRKIHEAMPLRGRSQDKSKYHKLNVPRSKILEHRCTHAWAKQLVEQGIHPRGSIWIPGPIDDNPEFGDLYAPDGDWSHGPHGPLPFMVRQQQALERMAGRPIIFRDINFDQFRSLSKSGQLPVGAVWSACLRGTIYAKA